MSDSEVAKIFVIPPRTFTQERSRRTYDALIKAAEKVFGKNGYDATQTPDIAGAAGVSVGTFYRYFGDKREVFLEIMQMHLQKGQVEVMAELGPEKFAGRGKRATLEHTLQVLLDSVTRTPKLERVFLEMALRDPEVADLRRRMEDISRDQVAGLIETICTRDQVPDPEATAYIVHTAVVECAIRIAGFRGKPPLPRERALAALTELVHRALYGKTEE